MQLLGVGLRLRVPLLRRLHRVLLHDHWDERMPPRVVGGRLVEGGRVVILRRQRRVAAPFLHRLQCQLQRLRVRRERDVLARLRHLRVRMRRRELWQQEDLLHGVPLRPV
jgi:hypothetical protein